MRQHVVFERADRLVVALHDGIAGRRVGRDGQGGVAAFGQPEVAPAVEQSDVGVAEQREDPQRVGRPPVALVAVDHHGVVAGDALAVHQVGELLAVDVVADPGVVEVGVPVDLHRAGNVADVVEQDVLVGFDDRQTGRAHVGREPVGGDEPFGVGVGRQRGAWICGKRHTRKPTHPDGVDWPPTARRWTGPRPRSSDRVSGSPMPTTADGSPSTPSMNHPPRPSRVNPPATRNDSPEAR